MILFFLNFPLLKKIFSLNKRSFYFIFTLKLLFVNYLFIINLAFAQSPIKPLEPTIASDASNSSDSNQVSVTASPLKLPTSIESSPSSPSPTPTSSPSGSIPSPQVANPTQPSAIANRMAIQNPGNPSMPAQIPNANQPPAIANRMAIQNPWNPSMPMQNPNSLPIAMPMANPAGAGNLMPPGFNNNMLGQISAASISNSISKIFGNGGEAIPTIMFNDQELANINRALDSLKNNQIYVPEGLEKDEEKKPAEEEKKSEEDEIVENEKSYIYLGSIIYFSPKDWVIWLNDQKISTSNNTPEKEIYVSMVDKDRIKIRWKMSLTKWKILSGKKDETLAPRLDFDSNIVESEFELRLNQTYILGSNSVVEGKAVIALIRKKESKEKSSAKRTGNDGTQDSSSNTDNSSSPVVKSPGALSTIKTLQQMNQQIDDNAQQVR